MASGATTDDFAAHCPAVSKPAIAAALEYEADELHDFCLDCPPGVPGLRAGNRRDRNRPPGAGQTNAIWKTCPELWQVSGLPGGV